MEGVQQLGVLVEQRGGVVEPHGILLLVVARASPSPASSLHHLEVPLQGSGLRVGRAAAAPAAVGPDHALEVSPLLARTFPRLVPRQPLQGRPPAVLAALRHPIGRLAPRGRVLRLEEVLDQEIGFSSSSSFFLFFLIFIARLPPGFEFPARGRGRGGGRGRRGGRVVVGLGDPSGVGGRGVTPLLRGSQEGRGEDGGEVFGVRGRLREMAAGGRPQTRADDPSVGRAGRGGAGVQVGGVGRSGARRQGRGVSGVTQGRAPVSQSPVSEGGGGGGSGGGVTALSGVRPHPVNRVGPKTAQVSLLAGGRPPPSRRGGGAAPPTTTTTAATQILSPGGVEPRWSEDVLLGEEGGCVGRLARGIAGRSSLGLLVLVLVVVVGVGRGRWGVAGELRGRGSVTPLGRGRGRGGRGRGTCGGGGRGGGGGGGRGGRGG